MRLLWWSLGIVAALALVLTGAGFAASELGGEVVTLRTADGSATRATHLWIVDAEGHGWLRAGSPTSGWLRRLGADPRVTIDRAGRTSAARATPVPDPGVRDRVNQLMRDKYGFADRMVGLVVAITGSDRNRSVPVRLDPLPPRG